MTTRIVVALVALPFVLIPIYLGGIWSVALFLVVALIGGHEFYNMLDVGGYFPARWLGLIWTALLVLSFWSPTHIPSTTLLTAGLIITLCYSLFRTEAPVSTWLATAGVAIYLGIMIGQMLGLRLADNGLWWLVLAALITWSNDTLAYFSGVTLGRHKLWPRLSPKKTWEGTIGGWIGAGLAGALVAHFAPLPIDALTGLAIGLVGGILALFGDLSVSMIKRQVGVKDSGTLFPGHGGMLDRLDSLLFVIPFVYQAVFLFGR